MSKSQMDFNDPLENYTESPTPTRSTRPQQASHPPKQQSQRNQVNDGHRYNYLIEKYSEGAIGTVLLGASSFNPSKIASIVNKHAGAGYRMVFMIKESRRMLLFWKRECIIMTFERAVS